MVEPEDGHPDCSITGFLKRYMSYIAVCAVLVLLIRTYLITYLLVKTAPTMTKSLPFGRQTQPYLRWSDSRKSGG